MKEQKYGIISKYIIILSSCLAREMEYQMIIIECLEENNSSSTT